MPTDKLTPKMRELARRVGNFAQRLPHVGRSRKEGPLPSVPQGSPSASSRYYWVMATTKQSGQELRLPTEDAVKATRAALLAQRTELTAEERKQRAEAVRAAGTGHRLGLIATPDLYR